METQVRARIPGSPGDCLLESEERQRLLFETTPHGLVFQAADGVIQSANPAAERILGLTLDQMQGRTSIDPRWRSIHEDGTPFPGETHPAMVALRTGRTVESALMGVFNPVSGDTRWIHVSATPLFHPGEDRPTQVMSSFVDITERKRAEDDLRISQANLAEAQRIAHLGYWEREFGSSAARWSEEACRIFGLPPETGFVELEDFFRRILPEDRDRVRSSFAQAIQGHGLLDFKYRILRPDGTQRHVHSRGRVEQGPDGKPLRTFGTMLDITARNLAEEALREAHQFNEQIINSAQEGIIVYGLDLRCRVWNPFMETLTGLPADELLGKAPEEVFPFLRETGHYEHLEQALAGLAGGSIDFPFEVPRTGKAGWVTDTAAPLRNGKGEIIGVIETVSDITGRKRSEELLAASLEQLSALVGQLQQAQEEERIRVSREVHDELGQLLTGLKMDVRWLERKLSEPGLPPALNPLLDRVVGTSELADMMIATVKRIAGELRPIALDQLGLEAALSLEVRRFGERSGITCTLSGSGPFPALPPATESNLFYIFREALTNVARHAHAAKVELAWRSEAGAAVFEVRDDGRGRAGNKAEAAHSLGMIGMRERAAQCGGTIAFEPNEGRGLRVTVRVPFATPSEEGKAVP